jgi:hypothetical protein
VLITNGEQELAQKKNNKFILLKNNIKNLTWISLKTVPP